MIRYLSGFLIALAACAAWQSSALNAAGGKTVKSESNYFSSLARIQSGGNDQPKAMLLGSSMTGRLADRARQVPGIANLGCDGGTALVTLRAIDQGLLPAASHLVVEANTLIYDLDGRGKETAAALHQSWFRWGKILPNISATARPSAFVYSALMARKLGKESHTLSPLPLTSHPEIPSRSEIASLPEESERLAEEVSSILARLKSRGTQTLIIYLPGGPRTPAMLDLGRSIAARSGSPWWDLAENLPDGSVGFTDSLHLDAASAGKVMLTLQDYLTNP